MAMNRRQHEGLIMSVRGLVEVTENLELSVSKGAISRVIGELDCFTSHGQEISIEVSAASRFGWLLTNVSTTMTDELQSVKFFKVKPLMESFLEEDISAFGERISDVFPNSAEDIVEAGKCLALGRSTASVFHLMRAMELAVQRISLRLDFPASEKEWGKLLSYISKAIESLPKGEERDAWSEALSNLYHVKQAWRNKTMHPKRTYTEAEANSVYNAVASFYVNITDLVLAAP